MHREFARDRVWAQNTALAYRANDLGDGTPTCRMPYRMLARGLPSLVPAHVLDAFDVDRRAGQWERILRAEPRHTYVATHEDEVIGFVRTERAREGTPVTDTELSALYVRARWYGTGLADELIRAVLTPTNPYSLWVFQCNPRAVTFYRRHDFVADGHSRTDYFSGLTEIRMRRLLPD